MRMPPDTTRHLAPLLLFTALALGACTTSDIRPDPPRISLVGVELREATLFEQRFLLRIRLQNPNDRKISIKGMDYELFINGSLFAHGVSAHPTTLPAFGEAVAELEVISNLSNIIDQVAALREAEELTYRIVGNVKLSTLQWPAKIPFEYSGELKPP